MLLGLIKRLKKKILNMMVIFNVKLIIKDLKNRKDINLDFKNKTLYSYS